MAQEFINFVNETPTQFHSVNFWRHRLLAKGFIELLESEAWDNLKFSGKYFMTKNESAIVAFTVGPTVDCIKIMGTHTDSPVLKLAPRTHTTGQGIEQLNVMTYGGGLWHTWFDRDLKVAGRIIVNIEGKLQSKLVHLNEPLVRIPNLAIHLSDERNKFEFNKERQLKPIFGLDKETIGHHSADLLNMAAADAGVTVEQIVELELQLTDYHPSLLMGPRKEFISSPRLDNQCSMYCSLVALEDFEPTEPGLCMSASFDNEEIGSQSRMGADSSLMPELLDRILLTLGIEKQEQYQIRAKSMLVSADMAHGIHPNYSEKHQPQHAPKFNSGICVKINANQRYATDQLGNAICKMIAQKVEVPIQEFIIRNDSMCGSTIGPILAGMLGMRTVDIGMPQFAMHSIREMMSSDDVAPYITFMKAFFEHYNGQGTDL